MTIIDDKIWDEKLQHSVNRKQQKYQYYNLKKLINMNIKKILEER